MRGDVRLWLPEGGSDSACVFADASSYSSMLLTAPSPATFVQLLYAQPLRMDDAVLVIPGRAPMRPIDVRTGRFEPHEYQEDFRKHGYMFAFPPSGPGTWDQLEMRVPIEGTDSSLHVRFVRDEDARSWLDRRCLDPRRRLIPAPSAEESEGNWAGAWARAELQVIGRDGTLRETTGIVSLWLPNGRQGTGYSYGDVSSHSTLRLAAAGRATFVMLRYPRPLLMDDAVLVVAGGAPMRRIDVRTDLFSPHEYREARGDHLYMFAFPPAGPGTWESIEIRVPIEGTGEVLRGRFVRDQDARPWLDPRCLEANPRAGAGG